MTATPELFAAAPRHAFYYVVGAFSAPRLRVMELTTELGLKSLAWQIVLFSALLRAMAVFAGDFLGSTETVFLPAGYATGDLLIGVAIEFAIAVAGFAAAIFLWRHLFGYRDRTRGVWAASAMAACPAIILSVLLEIIYFATETNEPYYAGIVALAFLLISAMLAGIYYSAALGLSYARATILSIVGTTFYFIAEIGIVFAILASLWITLVTP